MWAEALEHHLQAATAADGDPSELGRLHFELGNLYRNQLSRPELALEHYRNAFDFDAAQRPAIVAARALVTELGDYEQAADLLAREAESLPAGAKRAAAFVELSSIYKNELKNRVAATAALREAIGDAPNDLHLQHELATLLLEEADRAGDKREAELKRREAADVLTHMAGAVSDDYALAYVEAALDAVPDHPTGLALLEQLAPRLKRGDVLAPRWLAAIRGTKDRTLARTLRLNMARAYVSVGQLADAKICLDPLLAEGDVEARDIERSLGLAAAANPGRPSSRPEPRKEEPSVEEALASSELMLDDELEEHALHDGEDAASDSLADQLGDLLAADGHAEAGAPLADLATLERADRDSAAQRRSERAPAPQERGSSSLLDSSEHANANAKAKAREEQGGGANAPLHEELLDSSELALANLGPFEAKSPGNERAPSAAPPAPRASEGPARPPEQLAAAKPSERPGAARSGAPPSKRPSFGPPFDDGDVDPFAEETQPRAAPLTLAELTALTGHNESRTAGLPDIDEEEHDADSEVTQITPAEDPQIAEVRSLRTELSRRLRFRDRRGAAEVSETLIERGVFDPEAIEALEEHYRLTRDFRRLRDLSLRISRETSFSATVRAARLREAVMLSESKLGDQDGAATALRELLQLEPKDAEAFDKFKRVLAREQRWDELASVLEQRANESSEPRIKAELLRQLGSIEREKRGAPARAIAALARARELDPDRPEDDVALSELYLNAGLWKEAAAAMEARLARDDVSDRTTLLASLAKLYEEQLRDDAGALRALSSWRALEPRRVEPIDAVIRVHERRGDAQPLVDALVERLALSPIAERGKLHVRIAQLALSKLDDAPRAADAYAEAIALAPHDRSLWQAAAAAFAQAGRAAELDALLWNLAQGTRDRTLQARLWGHLAETRALSGDLGGAILAREAQLGASSEVSVLEALVALLREADRATDLARRLDELARRSESDVARSLRLERASVLAQKLRDPEAAKSELERVLSELAPDDAPALRMLVELCVATGDTTRRASAQERLVKLAPSLSSRIELAVELVDLYEHELHDSTGAIRVLFTWTTLEPQNPQPYLRLIPLLTQAGRRRELIDANDKLAALAMADEEAGEFSLRAARVAIELEDYDGAWNRLVPRVVESDDHAAELLLRELSITANRGEQLAALYVGLAQRAENPQRERQRWSDAARIFEQQVGAHDRALEAMLRALAKQLDSEELLREVERLSERARAWSRLAQVYDTLIRKADNTDARISLLLRHASLLERRAEEQGAAFERVWLAFQLDPSRDVTYEEAKRLARATDKREELLSTFERRAQSNASSAARIDALLEACSLAQHGFEDPARATGYLSRAVMLAGDATAQLDVIEARVQAVDEQQPAIHGRGLLAELAGVYAALAAESSKKPELASAWLARAARIQEHTLDDPTAAFRVLERASALAPGDDRLLDELHRVAALAGKWEALANHLQHTADVAIDSRSSSAALSRLGALYERELGSPTRAADAYEQLVRLRPQDAEASRRLRTCLHAAERFEELLIAIDRELFMLKPEDGKRELLKQAAETWEFGLKNRYEALDAWRKVAALAPQDPDVVAALTRLRSRPRADDSLLDGDLVVLPEDLRPSLTGTPVNAALFVAQPSAERAPIASFLGEPANALQSPESELVEPEEVTSEDLSMLSSELSLAHAARLRGNREAAAEPSVEASMELPIDEELAANELAELEPALEGSPTEDLRDEEVVDEVAELLNYGSREGSASSPAAASQIVDLPDATREFDADVTIPLDRLGPQSEVSEISLEGLSSLVDQQSDRRASPRPPPPAPKAPRRRK